jgi:hypothetical protein
MYFHTVRTVDPITGKSEIKPDITGKAVRFQHGVIAWDRKIEPIMGQRLSYDVVPEWTASPALKLLAI